MPKSKMLSLLGFLIVPLLLMSSCAGQEDTASSNQTIEDVTLEEAFTLIEDNRQNDDFIIVDLRTAGEYAEGHITKAINLDYDSETFSDELNELDKDKIYLIYSQDDKLSGKALDMMAELGFAEVYNMLGGMASWERVRLPLEKE